MKTITGSILRMKPRKKSSHKGDFGRVLIVGGSADYAGAPALACNASLAVLRSGADLVSVAAPETISIAVNRLTPDAITKKIKTKHGYFEMKNADEIIRLSRDFDVVLIGNGIGRKSDDFIRKITKQARKPMVIDADAIKAIRLQDVSDSIITPHKKEFEILLKNSGLSEDKTGRDYFRKKMGNNVILLKGHIDQIISADKIALNRTGNPVMTKAGTGDVLAGLAAGFLAQEAHAKDNPNDPGMFRSACMAAYLNGAVGDYLLKKMGRAFIASDIVDNIHKVLK